METLSKAIASAREWGRCQFPVIQRPPVLAPAKSPSLDCAVIKSDAAWNAQLHIAGLGWTIATQSGTESFAKPNHHVKSPLMAEAQALRAAILKCKEKGLTRIRCESDSAVLIKALTAKESLAGIYGVLADISFLSLSFDSISFTWISREKNVVPDAIAKQILSVELVLMAPPNSG